MKAPKNNINLGIQFPIYTSFYFVCLLKNKHNMDKLVLQIQYRLFYSYMQMKF